METKGISLYAVVKINLRTDNIVLKSYIWMQDKLSKESKKQRLIEHYEVDIKEYRIKFWQVPIIT